MRSTVLAFLLLSARGGVAALAAWLVCRALRRAHAPSRLLCWLWLAVGLRFVLPWGIPLKLPRPESAPLAAAADTVQELGELPLLSPAPAAAAAAAPLPWYARLTPWHALAAVWLVGVLVLAVRGGIGYLKLKRCVALACKTPDGCYGGACVPAPFTLGFVRPHIYLPDSLQGPARQAVLLHEQTHIRRRDPLVKPLFYAVVCLHWFNPLAWLALRAFEHDMEAACDEAARQAADAKAALEQQQAALADTQTALEAALLDANSTLTAQQAAAQAQAAVTDAAKKAYEDATAALDAYVREQSRRYTTADLHLTSLDFRCPLDSYGRITTQFAEPDPWGIPHRGTDFAAPGGTPIYAIADGVVSAARTMNSYGNCVQVSHGTADDGHRYDSLYAHMSSIAVAQGAAVQKGDLLGYVGNTGNVYGAGGGYHLHLELRVDGSRVDPLGFVPTH